MKVEREIWVQLVPEFNYFGDVKTLRLAGATIRRPKNPQGLVVKVRMVLDRSLFTAPELTVSVKDTRVDGEAYAAAEAVNDAVSAR